MSQTSALIYFHADCLDGFGAAWSAWQRFGEQALYRPMHHGQEWDRTELAGKEVFILDFSFRPDDLREMATLARSVCQIDHHATARDMWADLLDGNGEQQPAQFIDPNLPLTVRFDLSRSGAALAWAHFHPEQPMPLALAHIEDIDLWRFTLPDSRAFNTALRLKPFEFRTWDALIADCQSSASPCYQNMISEGDAIAHFMAGEIKRLAGSRSVVPVCLRGEPVDLLQARRHGQPTIEHNEQGWLAIQGLAINASALFTSELGELLARQSGSYGLIWQVGEDNMVKVSLRACGKVNVAHIAERYGGGGHPNAAAFRLPLTHFVSEILGA